MEASPSVLVDEAIFSGQIEHGAPRMRLVGLQTDSALCRAAARGNEGAFDELHDRYSRPLHAFVFHLLGRRRSEDVEDVVQDSFTRAFTGIRDRNFDGSFRPWLYTIAHNRAIDVLRGERDVSSLDDEFAVVPAAPASQAPAQRAETRDELNWLVAAVEALPERQRAALLLRELAGLSHDEIAEQLKASPGSTRQLIGRARDNLADAAIRDDRTIGRSRRSLRRELIAATPVVSLAAATINVGAGAGAGAAWLFGGKIVATIAAIALAAGATTAAVQHETRSKASGHHASAASAGAATGSRSSHSVSTTPHRHGHAIARHQRERLSDAPAAEGKTRSAAPAPAAGGQAGGQSTTTEKSTAGSSPSASTKPTQSGGGANSVGDLPGSVVNNVGQTVNGSQSVGQTVNNVVGDVGSSVSGTVNNVTGTVNDTVNNTVKGVGNTVNSLLPPKK